MSAGAWAAGLLGVVIGSGTTTLINMGSDKVRFGRENKHRDLLERRSAYVALLAALGDDADARVLMDSLDDERAQVIAAQEAAKTGGASDADLAVRTARIGSLEDEYRLLHRGYREAQVRVNAALAAVRVTAPDDVYRKADALCDFAGKDDEDPARAAAMSSLLSAIASDLK